MNRLKAVSVLVALGSIAIVTVLTLPTAHAGSVVQEVDDHAGLAVPNDSVLAQTPPVSCTVATTQTMGKLGNQSFDTALLLSNVNGLSLIEAVDVPPGTAIQVPTIPDYYYINVLAGTSVSVTAFPSSAGGNYNLGLDVFDNTQTLIAEDADPVTFEASISLFANYSGRMYFRVFQLLTAGTCSGGTYNLRFTTRLPSPVPPFGYGMVMAGPDNAWPDWIGFNFQLVSTSSVQSGRNELMQLTVDASDLNDLSALGNRMRQIAAANSSVESFQIGNNPNLASAWGAPPNAHDYARVLCTAYQSIMQVHSWALVVSGGLATTGRVTGTWNGHLGHDSSQQDEREFLKEFINAGGDDCLDALGYNTLGFGTNYDAVPDVNGGAPGTNCSNGRCFRSVEKAHAIMESQGLDKPIWITGVGWLTAPASSCLSDPRWQGRAGEIVTPARQSDNLTGAYRYGRLSWPWLKAMFVFNLDFNMAPWYDECEPMRYYSVAGQPAFLALGAMSKEVYRVYLAVLMK